jgi:hypothetical protein
MAEVCAMGRESPGTWERRGLILAFLTIGMATLLVIVERTPIGMVVLLTVFAGSFIYPTKCFIDDLCPNVGQTGKRWRLTGGLACIVIFAVVIGIWFWPTPRMRITKEVPQAPQPGQTLKVNFWLRNDGRDAEYRLLYRILFVDSIPAAVKDRGEMEENLWKKFEQSPKILPDGEILGGEETWGSLLDESLTQDQISHLRPDSSAAVHVMGEFQYTDWISERPLQFCNLYQANVEVLPRCFHHNGVRH